eukprot:m.127250 g.127250  ORF g.127250 m.127250 type:complete len:1072 (-) comp15652_c0_seq1:56-3271(-)
MSEHQNTSAVLFVALSLLLGVFCRTLTQAWTGVIPYTVALLVCGVLWGVMDEHTTSELGDAANSISKIDPHLFLQVFLPLLIFESAFSMKWHIFKRLLPQMLALAVVGVIIAASLTACAMRGVIAPSWSWSECFMLGAILSATDPVAVVALLKELGGSAKLRTLIEGESLLNDGTAIVIFTVFMDLSRGVDLTAGDAARAFFQLSFGGIALGIAWGMVTIWLIGWVHKDTLVETTLTVASTYLLFHVAEEFCHVSGVLAIVTLGASFVWYGKTKISPAVAHSLHEFWSILAYFGETLVFVIAGVLLAQRVEFSYFSGIDYAYLLLLYFFLMIIRAVMVGLLAPVLVNFGYGFGLRRAAVLVHGGLRGAVSLAMALLVELEPDIRPEVRNYVLFYGSGITFLTLVINAPTAGRLVRWLGLLRASHAEKEQFTRGVRLLVSHAGEDLRGLIEKAPDDQKTLCNWPKVKQFISFEHFIAPIINPQGRRLTSAELAVINADPVDIESDTVGLVMPAEDSNDTWCARVRRPEARLTPHMQRLQEARLRFLRGTVEVYHQLALQGQLSSDALKALLAAEEAAEDRCHKPISEWADTLWPVCRNPRWLSFLIKTNTIPVFDRVLRWGVKSALSRGVRVASAYIEAHRRMVSSLKGNKEVIELIRRESMMSTSKAKAYLEKAARKYARETAQIYSEQAANRMLSKLHKHVHKLAGEGHFVDAELETLEKFIKKKQLDLLRGRTEFPPPSERDILRISRLFTLVDEALFNTIMMRHEELNLQIGELLIQANDKQDRIFFVAEGSLEYMHPDGFLQVVDRGSYLNVAESLLKKPSTITIKSRQLSRVLCFSADQLRSLIATSMGPENEGNHTAGLSHLTANLARIAGFELLFLFGGDMLAKAKSLQLRFLAQAQVRTARVIRELLQDASVITLRKGDAFEVHDLALVVMGRIASTYGTNRVETASYWQFCKAGEYACTTSFGVVVMLDRSMYHDVATALQGRTRQYTEPVSEPDTSRRYASFRQPEQVREESLEEDLSEHDFQGRVFHRHDITDGVDADDDEDYTAGDYSREDFATTDDND